MNCKYSNGMLKKRNKAVESEEAIAYREATSSNGTTKS
jgi:hypothetical protein